jgi:hypothetical protein
MKYTVHYFTRHTVDFVSDEVDPAILKTQAVFTAKNHARRPDIELLQILAEGAKSGLGNDNPQPPEPTRPLPPPPMPPLGSAGDLMLARVA